VTLVRRGAKRELVGDRDGVLELAKREEPGGEMSHR
jgi:hypothetical protein